MTDKKEQLELSAAELEILLSGLSAYKHLRSQDPILRKDGMGPHLERVFRKVWPAYARAMGEDDK